MFINVASTLKRREEEDSFFTGDTKNHEAKQRKGHIFNWVIAYWEVKFDCQSEKNADTLK